jgi:DNA polymerase-3 subunit delta'
MARASTSVPETAAAPPSSSSPGGPRPELRGLPGISGQPRVVSVLLSALRQGRPHHAYLFDGPEGVGKASCARALFAALNCLEPPGLGAACGSCASCSKLASNSHPDLIAFDMTLSGLAEEAERVIRRLQYPPFEGRVQMVIFDPADQFAAPTAVTAANRLLKTLEEPRPATHFVLITTAASSLLQTLRSRCQRLRFGPLADAELAATLREQHQASDADIATISKLSQGSLGRAVRYLQDREQLERAAQAAGELYSAAQEGRAVRTVEVAGEIGANREQALEVLELLWLRLHDDLRASVDPSAAGAAGHLPRPAEKLLYGLRAVRAAQGAIRGYTGAPLSLERMLRELHGALPAAGRPTGSRPASKADL